MPSPSEVPISGGTPTRPRTPGASNTRSPAITKTPSSAGPTVSSSGQRAVGVAPTQATTPAPTTTTPVSGNAPQHVTTVPKISPGVVHISAEKLERMRQEARELLLKDEDTADAIDAICEANGWSRDTFVNNRHQITYVELFMIQFPNISLVRHFPNLVHVKLMHVGLKELDSKDFASLIHLEVLWLAENDLTAVRNGGLGCCKRLKELHIYTNNLPSLEPFTDLPELEILNISNNRIASLDGIGTLPNLKSLYIANNLITSIIGKLDNNKALEELNLAGNKIASLREIPCLNLLPRLQKLYFADPVFGDNPVSLMSNYQTFTLSHVHAVTYLDFIFISPEQRLIAETTFTKKKVFYSMRLQSLARNFNTLCNEVQFAINEKSSDAEKSLAQLCNAQRDLDAVLEEASQVDGFLPDFKEGRTIEEARASLTAIESAIQGRRVEVTEMVKRGEQCIDEMASVLERSRSKLLLDLSSGGNIQLEDGRVKDLWYQSCAELLRTRFFASDYATLSGMGINDVKVAKVTRIHNRSLRATFDRALGSMVDVGDPRYKAALEYLFFAEPLQAHHSGEAGTLDRIVEYGFKSHTSGAQEASPGSIPMTNSLFLADQVRLMDAYRSGEYRSSPTAFTSRIVVSKVFLGRCVQERGGGPGGVTTMDPNVPLLKAGKPVDKRDYPKDVLSVYRSRPDDPKQRIWHCFDNTLVLPEYIVELTYSTSSISSPRPALSEWPQNRSEEAIQSLRKMFPGASQADINDFRPMAPYFLAFANWVTSGSMAAVAAKEAQEALAGAPMLAKSKGPILDGILTPLVISAEMLSNKQGGSFTHPTVSFRFHGRSLKHLFTAVAGDQSARGPIESFIEMSATSLVPKLANITILDLSKNALRMSNVAEWSILAMALPAVEKFNMAHNQILYVPPHPSIDGEDCDEEVKRLVGGSRFNRVSELNLSKNAFEVMEGFSNLGGWFPSVTTMDIRFNPVYHDPVEAVRVNAYVSLHCGLSSLAILNGAPVDSMMMGTRESHIKLMKSQPTDITTSLAAAILRVVGKTCLTVPSTGRFVDVGPNGRAIPDANLYGILSPDCGCIDPLNMRQVFDQAKDIVLKASAGHATLTMPGVRASFPKWSTGGSGTTTAQQEEEGDCDNDIKLVSQCAVLSFNGALLTALPTTLLPRVCDTLVHLQLQDHFISTIDADAIRLLINLESLDLRGNRIASIPPGSIGTLRHLKRLDLGRNLLESVDSIFNLGDAFDLTDEEAVTGVLPELTFLAVDGNRLPSVVPFGALPNLQELYVSSNLIQDEKQLNLLRDMPRLIILDLTLNPCCRHDLYRPYAIFHLKRLKVLDGQAIDTDEAQHARNTFAGRVSAELLNERIAPAVDWSRITVLNLASCALKEIILLEGFKSLQHLRLEHNSLVNANGLETCTKLLTLNLAHNRLSDNPIGIALQSMVALESLSLESNQITALEPLQLRLPKLKFLNVKSNELTKLGGLGNLTSLRELVVDRNKLRGLDRAALISVAQLRELHCSDNALKSLEGIQVLQYLVKATFVANRLGDIQDAFRCLQEMPIVTLVMLGNAVTRKPSYRAGLINAMPCLQSLDERPVTMEERERVEATFNPDLTPPNVVTDVRMNIVGGSMFVSPVIASPMTQQSIGLIPPQQRQTAVRPVHLGEVGGDVDMAVVGRSEGVGMGRGGGAGARVTNHRTGSADRGSATVGGMGYRSTRPMTNILPSAAAPPVRATRRPM